MPSISGMRVPPRYMPVLRQLAEFEDRAATGLLEALRQSTSLRTPKELSARLMSVEGIDSDDDADRWLSALFSLHNLHVTHDWGLRDIAERVSELPELELAPGQARAQFIDRLVAVLTAPQLAELTKAMDIATEYPNVFHTARVLSDVRPIFGDDLASGPNGAVITTTLKIDYYERGRLESFYVTMDEADTRELRSAADRGLTKLESLKQFLAKVELPAFDTSGED